MLGAIDGSASDALPDGSDARIGPDGTDGTDLGVPFDAGDAATDTADTGEGDAAGTPDAIDSGAGDASFYFVGVTRPPGFGLGHTVLRSPSYYLTSIDGTSVPEWVGDVLAGSVMQVGP